MQSSRERVGFCLSGKFALLNDPVNLLGDLLTLLSLSDKVGLLGDRLLLSRAILA